MEQLLQRYIRGEVSEEERLKVASWLDESPENMREFLALRKLYDLSLWQSDTNYNPQNEMFRLFGTKRSFSQNETFFFSHPYPPTLPFSA